MNKIVVLAGEDDSLRIDRFLADKTDFSREYIKKLIAGSGVTVNGKSVKRSYLVKNGDSITILVPEMVDLALKPLNMKLKVLFEDSDLLVIDKSAGMVVHPGTGESHREDSLVNAILHHCGGRLSGIGGVKRPGIVHRLDKDTSGLIVVAKNDKAHESLSSQFKDRTVSKVYLALTLGTMEHTRGKIIASIARDRHDRKKMAVTAEGHGKEAISKYEVVKQYEYFALLKIKILSGRTHQIRVHLAAIGHPIAGDNVYGNLKTNKKLEKACGLNRQFLHASEIEFQHPSGKGKVKLKSELPEDLEKVLACLDNEGFSL